MEPIDVVILAGGRGTRLASAVKDVPKPLAPVNGRPFLDYQFQLLREAPGIGRVVLALGHLAERVVAHYAAHPPNLDLRHAIEDEPLGTGGGLRNALAQTASARLLVLNGDSIFRWDIAALRSRHAAAGLDATIALLEVADTSRYGSVVVDGDRASRFTEKAPGAGAGLINAGVYLFERAPIEALPGGNVSLERDLLPRLASTGRLAAAAFQSPFLDIGLPETYEQARHFLPDLLAVRGHDAAAG